MIEVTVNGKKHRLDDVEPDMPLLWALRDVLGLTATKYGCGRALCGACTVHVDGRAKRSCVTPVSAVQGKDVVTLEGLSENGDHPLQKAWAEADVPQCGYCQPGQLMAAAALLERNPNPTDEDIDRSMAGNVCRCGTYTRIRRAIRKASGRDA